MFLVAGWFCLLFFSVGPWVLGHWALSFFGLSPSWALGSRGAWSFGGWLVVLGWPSALRCCGGRRPRGALGLLSLALAWWLFMTLYAMLGQTTGRLAVENVST